MGLFDGIPIISNLGAEINKKEGSTNAGNLFQGGELDPRVLRGTSMDALSNQQTYSGDPTKDVQNNPMLSGMFGQGGTLDQTNAEEQRLANQGYQLQPQDYEAYGQASGDIARQFGQSDQSLAQALSDRGLSSSGVAGAAFTGAAGNKMEQLAGMQKQIADARMQNTMQRLGQTRQFLSQLGGQANQNINDAQNRGIQKANSFNDVQNNRFNMANSLLGNQQGQANTQLQQSQQTGHSSDLMSGLTGALGLGSAATKLYSGMSGAPGGPMSGASTSAPMAGQSMLAAGAVA